MGASICEMNLGKQITYKDIIDNYTHDTASITKKEEKDTLTKTTQGTPKIRQQSFEIEIEKIISLNKLHTKNDNEVLFISDLEMQNEENISTYYPLFCVLTRVELISYLKKADFLSMRRPISKLPLKSIESVDVIKCDSVYHFRIKIKNNTTLLIFKGNNDDLIFKWVVVLNYFIGKVNKRVNI